MIHISYPSLFIIGAQRCATSTLYGYFDSHPEIFVSEPKEPLFFSHIEKPPHFQGPGDQERINCRAIFTEIPYLKLFENAQKHQLACEASTTYLHDEQACLHIAKRVINPKIIILLRNPIERALSCFQYKRNQGLEPEENFENALEKEDQRIQANWAPIWHYTKRGYYSMPVSRAFDIFGKKAVKLIRYDDFINCTPETLSSLVEFLDLHKSFPIDSGIHQNAAIDSRPITRSTKFLNKLLSRFLRMIGKKSSEIHRRTCTVDQLSDAVFNHLSQEFKQDVNQLSNLMEWDLRNWLKR